MKEWERKSDEWRLEQFKTKMIPYQPDWYLRDLLQSFTSSPSPLDKEFARLIREELRRR